MSTNDIKGNSLIHEFTEGAIFPMVLKFAFPLVLSNTFQMLYNMVDMAVVGQYVGKVGLSAVSIGGDELHLFTFLAQGFANAGQVILSQYIGAGRRNKLHLIIGTMFTVFMASAVFLSVFSLFFIGKYLDLLNTPIEALAPATEYITICMLGLIFVYGYNMVSAIMRGLGDSKHPLYFIVIASVVNLILDLVFVAKMNMGVAGAALATIIGQGISFLLALCFLYRRRIDLGFDFKLRDMKPDRECLVMMLKLGIPMSLQSAAISISVLFVNSFLNSYGVVVSAVSGIGTKISSVMSVVTVALTSSCNSIIGQNIGAGNYSRVRKTLGVNLLCNLLFALGVSLITILFTENIFGFFTNDADVLQMSYSYLPCCIINYFGFALRSPANALVNGTGHSKLNMLMGLTDGIVCRVGLSLLLGIALEMGVLGFWYGNALAGFAPFIIGLVFYMSNKWQKSVVK